MKADETSWRRPKTLLIVPGWAVPKIRRTTIMMKPAKKKPAIGDRMSGRMTLSRTAVQFVAPKPEWAIDAPRMPPIRAWLELEGMPRYQVIRFHVIAARSVATTA